jgi:hypothetical protein
MRKEPVSQGKCKFEGSTYLGPYDAVLSWGEYPYDRRAALAHIHRLRHLRYRAGRHYLAPDALAQL